MGGFKKTGADVFVWVGDPDCDGGHSALLHRLEAMNTVFLGEEEPLSARQKGNLGEFIALHVGLLSSLAPLKHFTQNATNPLQDISLAGIDIIHVHFDANPMMDLLHIQEVKTTSNSSMAYADRLVDDYKKLFHDDLDLTLQSRLQVLANKFELEFGDDALAERVLRFGSTSADTSTNVRLVPTVVHEREGADPVAKLLAVRTAITTFGWSPGSIQGWSVSLTDLEDRLERLARGKL